MKKQWRHSATIAYALVLLSITPTMWSADKKAVLLQTNQAYYNLKSNGMAEFSCQVSPDWDAGYKEIKMDSVGRDQILPIAKQMKFLVAVGPSGAATVSHEIGQASPSDDVADRLQKMAGGIEQMIRGFFQTWSQMMVNPPLPGTAEEYQMEEKLDGYRFTAEATKIQVAVSVSRDLIVDSIYAKTPEFEGTVHPQFERTKGGLVLRSYDATYKTQSGNAQQLSVNVQYQEIEGLKLPRTITLTMSLPQGHLEMPITLSECKVKKN